ncbi:MAG TPA: recombinase family protein [Streptosporangiaceae bacterium]|nr:recombinase family protein [Streptosporangiaceae bacterium]
MSSDDITKVTSSRLRRDACLCIRQSTFYQVINNTESTGRQYDLKHRAVTLGWPEDKIHVIDVDQGHSGASAADRAGFQHLVAEVSLGRAGIVLGLECSRLARDSADWQQLVKICAHTDTLICDEDGLYDPAIFNDRVLLGMKGQMSEFELHFLASRMRGGILAKARRGELTLSLPIGLAYDEHRQAVPDPDAGVRQAVALLFDTFTATRSAFAVVKAFRARQLAFPARHQHGPHRGELFWQPLTHSRVLRTLRNPAYAGAYAYGKASHTTDLNGVPHTTARPAAEWTVLIKDHHPGYITWDTYQANLAVLAANAAARGPDRAAGPPREGTALLQGIAVCGRCGRRMTIRYHARRGTLIPEYMCQNAGIAAAQPICQHIPGDGIDAAIAGLILDTLTPAAIEVSLAVADELTAQAEHADHLRQLHVQRAEHAADAARGRYLAVDPANRLVADTLEADWNTALRALADAREDYRKATQTAAIPDAAQRDKIRALAADLPALWADPATPVRERKRLARLLIKDATLTRSPDAITAAVRFPGGSHHVLRLPAPLNAWQRRKTPDEVTELTARLLDTHTYAQIADHLNAAGHTTGDGHCWDGSRVSKLASSYQLPSHDQRLQDRGLLTLAQIAADLHAHPSSIKRWHRLGLITGEQADDRGVFRYHPGQTRPASADAENARKRLGDDHRSGRRNPHRTPGRPRTPRQNVRPPGDTETTSTTET